MPNKFIQATGVPPYEDLKRLVPQLQPGFKAMAKDGRYDYADAAELLQKFWAYMQARHGGGDTGHSVGKDPESDDG